MPTESIFSGLKVVDVASWIAAPGATTILSDFGADVIKVEPPGAGDPYRLLHAVPPFPRSDLDYAWQLTNRNKRGIAVDLKSPQAHLILERLVKWADVLVTNYPHGARKRLKLTYEEISPWNPRLIYADITGFGARGPDAEEPGFDLTAYWARSGLLSMMRDAGSPPPMPAAGSGDHASAVGIYAAIVTALYRRERTGKGSYVSTSLLAEGAWSDAVYVQGALAGASFYPLHDRKNPANPLINPYQTSDERWFILATGPRSWPHLAEVVELPELVHDPRFADAASMAANTAALTAILDQAFGARPLAHWRAALDKVRITYGVLQTPEEVIGDPQMRANDILVPVEDGDEQMPLTVNSPLTVHDVPKVPPRRAPDVGEHNDEVLTELGFDAEQIASLRAGGTIPPTARPHRPSGVDLREPAVAPPSAAGGKRG